VPLVPDITATAANLAAIVDVLQDMRVRSVRLLPYNPLGLDMWEALGRASPPLPRHFMRPEELADLHRAFGRILGDLTARPIPEMGRDES
jgi:pyruvate-formate lyase-activating enzyme